jgi:glycosyltransferase involved in cell wall biosynthesis
MRVLYIAPHSLARDHSGSQIASLETLRSLQGRCRLHVLVPRPTANEGDDLGVLRQAAPDAKVHFYRQPSMRWTRVQSYRLAAASAVTGRSYLAGTWAIKTPGGLRDCVRRLALEQKFDVIHCEWLSTAAAIRGLRLPTLVRTLDVHFVGLAEWLGGAPTMGALQRRFLRSEVGRLRRFEVALLNAAELPVSVSADDAALLRGHGVEHISTIPPPMPVRAGANGASRSGRARRALFIGRLDLPVNKSALFQFADEIWPRVHPECRERVRVVFAGGEPDREVFERASRAGIEVCSSLPSAELKALFQQADVLVCPVTGGTGIKIKTLEAIAYGKAIVGYPNAFAAAGHRQPKIRQARVRRGASHGRSDTLSMHGRRLNRLSQGPRRSSGMGALSRNRYRN